MAVVDARGLPLGLLVASAQEAEVKLAEQTLATIRVARRRGRPRTRPMSILADKGYDSDRFRERLRRRGIRPCIPYRRGRRPRPGRKPNLAAYRQRWHIERTFAWLGSFRRLLVRFEHSATVYRGFLYLAAALICTRRLTLGCIAPVVGCADGPRVPGLLATTTEPASATGAPARAGARRGQAAS